MTTPLDPSAKRDVFGRAFAAWCFGLAGFQLALALGAPWGEAAWGGRNVGVLPADLRAGSAIATLVWLALGAIAIGRLLGPNGRRRTLLGAAVYISLGVAANAASPSALERAIWVPATVVGAGLAWSAWRRARSAPR